MNPDQYFSPDESEVWIIRIENSDHSNLGFIRIENSVQFHSDWKARIESDWILVRIKNLGLNRIDF